METTPTTPLNSMDDLIMHYGKAYLAMRGQLELMNGVTPEQAHEVAVEFMQLTPLSWFGEKQLPPFKHETTHYLKGTLAANK